MVRQRHAFGHRVRIGICCTAFTGMAERVHCARADSLPLTARTGSPHSFHSFPPRIAGAYTGIVCATLMVPHRFTRTTLKRARGSLFLTARCHARPLLGTYAHARFTVLHHLAHRILTTFYLACRATRCRGCVYASLRHSLSHTAAYAARCASIYHLRWLRARATLACCYTHPLAVASYA